MRGLRQTSVAGDRGSITMMSIGVFAIAALVIGVLADAGSVFIQRRALAAAADGAALAAAQAIDVRAIYQNGSAAPLTLSRADAAHAVSRHVGEARYSAAIKGFRVTRVLVTGGLVTVSVSGRAYPRLTGLVSGGGVTVTATSRARAVVRPR